MVVDGVVQQGSDAAVLVQAIVELARSLRLRTVAEGIEPPAQASALRRANCEQGQGYLFGRPVPAEDLERQLRCHAAGADRRVDTPSTGA